MIAIGQRPSVQPPPAPPPGSESPNREQGRAEAERQQQQAEAERKQAEAEQRRRQEAERQQREAELAERQRQQAELADGERKIYEAARGNLAALHRYVNTCILCAFAAAARGEIRGLEAANQDERMYRQSRGNLYALHAYVNSCDVCAFKSAALDEIAKLEAPKPDLKGIVNLAPKSDWIMIEKQWVHLFGIIDSPLYDRSHESDMRRYLEPSNGVVECFLRSAKRFQCFADGKDIALLALADGIATPEAGAPSDYRAQAARR